MVWNKRPVRIGVGLLLLAVGVIAILPNLTGYTSLDGTVNARFTIISAPIDGTITETPPKIGTWLAAGTELTAVKNARVWRTAEAQLGADLQNTKERLEAIDLQRVQLIKLNDELESRLRDYQQATEKVLAQEIVIRQRRIATAAARLQVAKSEFSRKSSLGTSGIAARSSVEQAEMLKITAEDEGSIASAELERLREQLAAVKRNVFVGENRNDVPYSQQRKDEVTMQLIDLRTRWKDLEARMWQLEKQLDQEKARNQTLQYAVLRMPFDGVIWRNSVVEGSNVIAGSELAQVLDCRELFVDILVSEVDSDQIYPGRDAQIRLFGRSESIEGKVASVRGSAALVAEPVLAATPPHSRGKNARIRVAIPPSDLQTDYQNFCQVGRSVQVRFKKRSLPFVNWIRSLWFSIT